MPIGNVHPAVLGRVKSLCANESDSLILRQALLQEIRAVVDFDTYAWLLTDPETEVGCAPLADVPYLRELPRLIRLKYSTTINRWTHLSTPVATLLGATVDRPERSLVWRELLSAHSVSDVASLVFRDRFGCWGFLDLWRSGTGSRFTEDETSFLEELAPVITTGLRQAQRETFTSVATRPERTGPIVMVLSPTLDVKAQTPETEAFLRVLVPPDPNRPAIPAAAYNVAAQLIASELGVDEHPATARVHLTGGAWLTLRAARIGVHGSIAERDIAVTIEATAPQERLALFARACVLTARETDLLKQLATGASTKSVATQMYVSQHTVQDHLKSIFAKTDTRSRGTLLARATGISS